jgi:uncharacterized membrane protein
MTYMNPVSELLTRQKTVAAGVVVVLLLLGLVLYPALPDRMAIHWNAAGQPDGTAPKLVAVLAMPAVVVLMSVLFELTVTDRGELVVGSLAMVLLFVVQVMVFLSNLGFVVPIVPVSLALALGLVALAVWFEVR